MHIYQTKSYFHSKKQRVRQLHEYNLGERGGEQGGFRQSVVTNYPFVVTHLFNFYFLMFQYKLKISEYQDRLLVKKHPLYPPLIFHFFVKGILFFSNRCLVQFGLSAIKPSIGAFASFFFFNKIQNAAGKLQCCGGTSRPPW